MGGQDPFRQAREARQLQAAWLLDWPAAEEAPSGCRAEHQADQRSGDDQLPGGRPADRDEARGRPRHRPSDLSPWLPREDDDRGVPQHDLQRCVELTEEGKDGEHPLRGDCGLRSAVLQPLHSPERQGDDYRRRVLRHSPWSGGRRTKCNRAAPGLEVRICELFELSSSRSAALHGKQRFECALLHFAQGRHKHLAGRCPPGAVFSRHRARLPSSR